MGMGQYVDTYVYSYVNANNDPIEDDFLQWVADIESEDSPPLVQSVSYGDYGGQYSNATVQVRIQTTLSICLSLYLLPSTNLSI